MAILKRDTLGVKDLFSLDKKSMYNIERELYVASTKIKVDFILIIVNVQEIERNVSPVLYISLRPILSRI